MMPMRFVLFVANNLVASTTTTNAGVLFGFVLNMWKLAHTISSNAAIIMNT